MARKWRVFSSGIRSFLIGNRERGTGKGEVFRFQDLVVSFFNSLRELKKAIARRYYRMAVLILSTLLGLALAIAAPVGANSTGNALELARQGQQRYDAGQFAAAAQLWQEAADAYKQSGDGEGMTKSLINKSQALQDLGLYPKACKTLLQAIALENPAECSPEEVERLLNRLYQRQDPLTLTQAIGLRGLGDVLRRQGILSQSEAVLQLALITADGTPEASATLMSLGNVQRALGSQTRDRWDYEEITEIIDRQSLEAALAPYENAFVSYRRAATMASASAAPVAQIQAKLNYFTLLLDLKKWWDAQTERRIASWSRFNESRLIGRSKDFLSALDLKLNEDASAWQAQIESSLTALPQSSTAIYARINFAQSLMQNEQIDGVATLLDGALQQARTLGDRRAETYALGYLGKLYYQQKQLSQATDLTRQALLLAQEQNLNGDAREIVYLWQSQLGSLLREQKDPKGAIAAYAAAFNTLQSLRSDLNANGRDIQFNFLQEVKPVYLDLVDLLLNTPLSQEELNALILSNPSTDHSQSNQSRNRLELARDAIESLQLAELDNFFQDPCSQEADIAIRVDDIDPKAAVIYPIILPDRLEVILSLPGKPLQEAKTAIAAPEVNDTLERLYDYLDNITVNNSARNILATANPDPQELKENLQQLLPIFGQIYDWLIRPFEAELAANQIENLVFVSNGQLQRVPMAALYDGQHYAIEKYGVALVPSLQLIDFRKLKQQPTKVLAAGVSEQVQVREEIFPALVNVPNELERIEAAFPASEKLLNQEFTAETLQSRLRADFPVVHLATHGLFSSNPQKNFIVTGDGNSIDIDRLTTLLRTEEATRLELLVLSACETATGDERAVLGLAGVAIRSGARSTLATLWPVEDASTAEVMGQFYRELKKTEKKKLSALRSAQLSLLESLKIQPTFNELKDLPPHPYYWASFVLVGNWQ
jgi:CHAT domain-containing protein